MSCRNLLVSLVLMLSCIFLGSCIQQPIPEPMFYSYNQTKLCESSSGDVMAYMDMSLTTLISQSNELVVSWGEDKKGYQEWIDMVAFDEQKANAARKYFFFVDEKARHIPFLHPKWTARFDAELILDKAVLDKPYADEKVRTIAIYKEIQTQFDKDIAKVTSDNKMLSMCQLAVDETFAQTLLQLKETPAWATQFDTPEGWTFDSRNYFTGTVHMHEENGIVKITIQLGAVPWYKGESEPGKIYEPNKP